MNTGPTANPLVVLREEFDDWAVLFDPDSGTGFGLNPTSVLLWKLLDGKHTVDALLGEIRRTHAESVPEEAGADKSSFHFSVFTGLWESVTRYTPTKLKRSLGIKKRVLQTGASAICYLSYS